LCPQMRYGPMGTCTIGQVSGPDSVVILGKIT
jgi:hypothetical protein